MFMVIDEIIHDNSRKKITIFQVKKTPINVKVHANEIFSVNLQSCNSEIMLAVILCNCLIYTIATIFANLQFNFQFKSAS